MANLTVPYKSQWDQDANADAADNCGPTCVAMVLSYYGKTVSTNDVFQATGAPASSLISFQQLITAYGNYNYHPTYEENASPEHIKALLDQNIPVLALVHYGSLSSRQDTRYIGGHFVLVVGYRDDGYFVNDPDFWGDFRKDGDHHFYTKSDFEIALSSNNTDGGNPNGAILWVSNDPMVCDPKSVRDAIITKASAYDEFVNHGFKSVDDVNARINNLVEQNGKLADDLKACQNAQNSTPPVVVPSLPVPPVEPVPQPNQAPKPASLWQQILDWFGIK